MVIPWWLLGVDGQVVLQNVILLNAVFYEEWEPLDVEHDISLDEEVRHTVDRRRAVERVVYSATAGVGA